MIIFDNIFEVTPGNPVQLNEHSINNKCRVRVVKMKNQNRLLFLKKYYIVSTELTKGFMEKSITFLAPLIVSMFKMTTAEFVWFIHYPDVKKSCPKKPAIDVVMMKPNLFCGAPEKITPIRYDLRPAMENEIQQLKKCIPDIQ